MNLSYGTMSDETFTTPRLMVQQTYSDPFKRDEPTLYGVIFAPGDLGRNGFHVTGLTREEMERLRDRIHALYNLHRSQFNDSVFEYVKAFQHGERKA